MEKPSAFPFFFVILHPVCCRLTLLSFIRLSTLPNMMKRRLLTLILILTLTVGAVRAAVGAGGWEPVKTEMRNAKSVVKEADVEILTAPGYIIVNTDHQIQIKVFTILGRVVSEETLSAGQSRLPVTAHGVYIVKIGELTCKIAL